MIPLNFISYSNLYLFNFLFHLLMIVSFRTLQQ
nr:MAG TPA: hypothetical protein [Caudoviricetes sp.]